MKFRFLVFLMLPACWLPLETGKQMQADIAAMQEEIQLAQKNLAEQQIRLDAQMKQADDKIQELNRAARLSDADFGVQLERLIKDAQELRGQNELAMFRLEKIEERLNKFVENDAPTKEKELPKDKDSLFERATAYEKDDLISDARGVYREIIKRWPKDTGITDKAYFRIGETYFKEKRFRDALQSYIKVVEQFEKSAYADKAYYQIGLCSLELGNLEDAAVFFNEVVTRYKKSPLIKDATAQLASVRKRLAKEKQPSSKKPATKN